MIWWKRASHFSFKAKILDRVIMVVPYVHRVEEEGAVARLRAYEMMVAQPALSTKYYCDLRHNQTKTDVETLMTWQTTKASKLKLSSETLIMNTN